MARCLIAVFVVAALSTGCASFRAEEFAPRLVADDTRLPLTVEIDTRSLLQALGEGSYRLAGRSPAFSGPVLFDQSVPLLNELAGLTLAESHRDADELLRIRWIHSASTVIAASETWEKRQTWTPYFDERLVVSDSIHRDDDGLRLTKTWSGDLFQERVGQRASLSSQRDLSFEHSPAVSDAEANIAACAAALLDTTATVGRLRVSFPTRKDHVAERAWLIPSGLTLGLINLFGAPLGSQRCRVEIVLEVFDAQGLQIGSYAASGEGSGHAAAYWGHAMSFPGTATSSDDLSRVVIARALRNALERASAALLADAERLHFELQG